MSTRCYERALRILLLALALVAPGTAPAAFIVFQDDFNAEVGTGDGGSGGSGLGYTGFTNWTITDGTVDLIANTDFGITCPTASGKCVDLDGISSDAGVMTSINISLDPGTYQFSYTLAGTSSSFTSPPFPPAAEEDNIVDVSIGALFSEQVTVPWATAPQVHGGIFSVVALTNVSIVIGNQGGDNFGAMLDNVVLINTIPEPGTALLLGMGLLVISLRERQRAR